MSDETAGALWLEPADEPTVNKAFSNINRIGDTRTTLRTDLGEDWLLCNGDAVDEEEYPGLYGFLLEQNNPVGAWKYGPQISSTSVISAIAYGNGYWLIANDNRLSYRQGDPTGAWTQASTTGTDGASSFPCIGYGDGWFAGVELRQGSYRLFCSNAVVGTWSSVSWVNTTAFSHGGGYWVSLHNSPYTQIRYVSGPPNGSWTVGASFGVTMHSVVYGDDYWVASDASETLKYKQGAPTGAVGTWLSHTQAGRPIRSVAYGNGYWVGVSNDGDIFYVSGDPTGTWTKHSQTLSGVNKIKYAGGYWFVGGTQKMYCKQGSPEGAWIEHPQMFANPYSSTPLVDSDGIYWAAATREASILHTQGDVLPAISGDAHTYIKAR